MKKLLISLMLIAGAVMAFAEKVTLPATSLVTVPPKPIPVTVDWDEKWFGKNPSSVYNHDMARIAAVLSAVSYVDVENDKKNNALTQIYKTFGVKDSDMEFFYDIDYDNPFWGNDQCAFSIASKTINSSFGKRTLIFLVIRGTPLNSNEWISNINLSDKTEEASPIHEGFARASQQIQTQLYTYMLKRKIDVENSFFLITGHSRGAAVTNMICAEFAYSDIIVNDNIYAYTFAAPNVTTYDIEKDQTFDFIWNIVSAEDIVPTVPMNRRSWNYKKYGNTRTIVNYWNCDHDTYENNYLPRMNKYYSQFLERDFCPFYMGPFIPVQVTDIATSLNDTVKTYYRGFSGMRTMADKLFRKIFPPIIYDPVAGNTLLKEEKDEEYDSTVSSIVGYLNNKTDGLADYAVNAFVDMHAAEGYLSWMLALEENEIFSVMPYSQIVISGNFDCAVFDKQDNCVVKIQNGHVKLGSLKYKIPARTMFPEGAVIGIPANEELDIYVGKDSMFPTPSFIKVEHFRSDGVYQVEGAEVLVTPRTGKMYHINAGGITQSQREIVFDLIKGRSRMFDLYNKADINPRWDFMTQFEITLDTNLCMTMGAQFGCQNIYGSTVISQNLSDFANMTGFDLGVGHQRNIVGILNVDHELSGKFRWVLVDQGEQYSTFNFVPSFRVSLSIKPVRRFHIFAAGLFDCEIKDFNDGAFTPKVYKATIHPIPVGDKVNIYPAIQFGFKF